MTALLLTCFQLQGFPGLEPLFVGELAEVLTAKSGTMRTAYPSEKPVIKVGMVGVRFGGQAHEMRPDLLSNLLSSLKQSTDGSNSRCGFHPDHVIELAAGTEKATMLPCFGCGHLAITYKGRTYFGTMSNADSLKRWLESSIPSEDYRRASREERFSPEFEKIFQTATATWEIVGKRREAPMDKARRRWLVALLGQPKPGLPGINRGADTVIVRFAGHPEATLTFNFSTSQYQVANNGFAGGQLDWDQVAQCLLD